MSQLCPRSTTGARCRYGQKIPSQKRVTWPTVPDASPTVGRLLDQPTSWLPTIRAMAREQPPGDTFSYDNCGAHLLGAHLAEQLGESLEQFAARELFAPLGITRWAWPEDPDGYLTWVDEHGFFLGGWAGQHVTVVPRHELIVVTTGLPELLTADWQPARDTVVPVLVAAADRLAGGSGS